jgi:hypothetical protein
MRKYKNWTKKELIERIKDLEAEGRVISKTRLVLRRAIVLPDKWPFSALVPHMLWLERQWLHDAALNRWEYDYGTVPNPNWDDSHDRYAAALHVEQLGCPPLNRGDMVAFAMRQAELNVEVKEDMKQANMDLAQNLQYTNGESDISIKEQFVVEPFVMLGPNAYPDKEDIDYATSNVVFEIPKGED